jgi:hypothetical protein
MNVSRITADANLYRLRNNSYPGRGIVIGRNKTGKIIQVYWIMGRSGNSRKRIFESDAAGRVQTVPTNPAEVKNPELIIYSAMIERDGVFAVSNGSQTLNIIADGFSQAMIQYCYEPDSPNFTPRILAVTNLNLGYEHPNRMAIIRKSTDGELVERFFYELPDFPGYGHCIHTYECDGNPLPSFDRRPYLLPLDGSIEDIANALWEALDEDNRVSLVVKTIDDLKHCHSRLKIINKYRKVA